MAFFEFSKLPSTVVILTIFFFFRYYHCSPRSSGSLACECEERKMLIFSFMYTICEMCLLLIQSNLLHMNIMRGVIFQWEIFRCCCCFIKMAFIK